LPPVERYGGLNVFEANNRIIEDLKKMERFLKLMKSAILTPIAGAAKIQLFSEQPSNGLFLWIKTV